jgi:tetratricopeptide (TPR) repeat protein
MALDFLTDAPKGMDCVLQIMSDAESLTDDVAKRIFSLAPLEGVSSDLFIRALHYADFIEPRNSEWNFSSNVRQELQRLNVADSELVREANRMLAEIGRTADRSLAGSIVPAYLFTDAGQAYHEAAAGNTEKALSLYARAALGHLTGIQWLASNLAEEQERRQIIPRGNIETTFLRAMVLFRQGKKRAAEPLLRKIAQSDEKRIEVAIALHILGNLVSRTNSAEAEEFLRRSVKIGSDINDSGLGQSLHSLANVIARHKERAEEAEAFYLRSIDLAETNGNAHDVAKRRHSLANHLAHDFKRAKEAEVLYLLAVKMLTDCGDEGGVAQTLHSLGNLLARHSHRKNDARQYYLQSIAIDSTLHNYRGVAKTTHSLANLLASHQETQDEAQEHYLRSIKMARETGTEYDVAQRLHSFGKFLSETSQRFDDAEALLRESLALGRELKNLRHQAQVLHSLSAIVEKRSAEEAEQLLIQSLELDRRAGNRRGEEIVRASLQSLRKRFNL